MKWCVAGVLWAAAVLLPWAAEAQEAAAENKPASKVQSEQLVDVVRLKNGGLVRGIISELVPDDYVVITLASGEQRRFAWSEVEYAGPGAKDPAAATKAAEPKKVEQDEDEEDEDEDEDAQPKRENRKTRPLITVNADEASLSFEAGEPNITFHIKTSSATAGYGLGKVTATGYDRICTAPCTASLPAGTYEMAYSRAHQSPKDFYEPVTLRGGNETVRADFDDHSLLKTVGGVTLVAGLLGGITMALTADPQDGWGTQRVLGVSTALVGGLVGIGLLATPESATLKVSPRDSEWQ
jgi:hypothetical protein